jgi:hypothetical protein
VKVLRRPLLLASLLAALGACATLAYREVQLSSKLRFSHKQHLEEADCGDCHGEVAESKGATRGRFIGQGEHGGCAECHDIEEGECKTCHIGNDRQVKIPRRDRGLRFSHAAHQEIEGGCKRCHAAAYSASIIGQITLAGHDVCDDCHAEALTELRCDTCHRDLHRQRVQPIGLVAHRGNFVRNHGAQAADPARCASCHDQTFCSDCHARTNAPGITQAFRFPERIQASFIHRGDFVARHAAASRADPASCRKCHGARHCTACHELQGLSVPSRAALGARARKAHGPDVMQPGSPGFHGRLARRDISRCAACHDRGAASNCVNCHKVGQLGGNPHPRGFRWRDKSERCRTSSMCTVCHVGGAGCR